MARGRTLIPRRLSRVAVGLLAICLGGIAAGCGGSDATSTEPASPPRARYIGRPGAPRVTVAGDSITELARPAIVDALRGRYRVRIDAFTGRTIGEVTPAVIRQLRTHPDVAVVNLGTNDMDRGHTHWRADLDRVLQLVADVPCVEVFTIYDGHHRPVGANVGTRINERLRAAAARGSIHLVDWNAAVHADPSLIVADGIHPGTTGQAWIAQSIRDRVEADC